MLASCTDLTSEQQNLIYAGTELDDNRTLTSYGITNGSTLRQEALHWWCGGIQILVWVDQRHPCLRPSVSHRLRCDGDWIALDWVHPRHTIGWVKGALLGRTGIPTAKQRLTLRGLELGDDRTLASYGVTSHTVMSQTYYTLREEEDVLRARRWRRGSLKAGAATPLRDSTPPPRRRRYEPWSVDVTRGWFRATLN